MRADLLLWALADSALEANAAHAGFMSNSVAWGNATGEPDWFSSQWGEEANRCRARLGAWRMTWLNQLEAKRC